MRSLTTRLTRDDILTQPVEPVIWRITLPMLGGLLSVILFSVADTYFVAQLGTQPLAALSFTIPVTSTIVALAFGMGSATASLVSRAYGADDHQRVRELTTAALLLAFVLVVVMSAIGVLTMDPVFHMLGAGDETLPLIRAYMMFWYAGMVFLMIPIVGNSAIRATGDTRFPALIMICAAVINTVLDPILIFGWFGVPALGIQGAAIATVIARGVIFVAAFYVLHVRLNMLTFSHNLFRHCGGLWAEVVQTSAATTAMKLIQPISMTIVVGVIATLGEDAVAAYGIAGRIQMLVLIPFFALTAGLAPFAGQNWGAGQYDRLRQALRSGFRFVMVWGAVVSALLWLFGSTIAGWFSDDPMVRDQAARAFGIVSLSYGVFGLAEITASHLVAVGQVRLATGLAVVRLFLLYVPLATMGKMLMGFEGVFWGAVVANGLAGVIAVICALRYGVREGVS